MLLTVVQAMGRGVRHEEDFCVSYLLDEQIALVMSRKPSLMPPWFRQALEFENADVLFGISDPEVEKRGSEDW
jgi:Rad3-related DNA helicase